MLVFGLHSTSDDRLSDLSDESQPKCKKRPPKSSKNQMLIFGLCSTSDDWLSNPSNESRLKYKKRPPKSSKNEMGLQQCLFTLLLRNVKKYVQLNFVMEC